MFKCLHQNISCLNQFELIRKYRCSGCGEVMICDCDETIGRRFLAHQLDHGTELETQQEILVTLGFQSKICPECRGLPPVTAPVAAIHGRTSKIKRYYWREIEFQKMERLANWLDHGGSEDNDEGHKKIKEIEREVLDGIKQLHATSPKYDFRTESQDELIRKYQVNVVRLDGVHVRSPESKRVSILDGSEKYTPEQFVCRHFHQLGFRTLFLESSPFHVLFGVFLWPLIQDPEDPLLRLVSFGDRHAFEQGGESLEISTSLPGDFGTRGYATRRAAVIEKHFAPKMQDRDELKRLFDYWLSDSEDLRQYLWAHREQHVMAARAVLDILPPVTIIAILRYLVQDYWGRYCGWPDLLVHRECNFFFVEVKSSRDKLNEDQKRWIRDNGDQLKLPFQLVKIHNSSRQKIR